MASSPSTRAPGRLARARTPRLAAALAGVALGVAGCGGHPPPPPPETPVAPRATIVPAAAGARTITSGTLTLRVYAPAMALLHRAQVRLQPLAPTTRVAGGYRWLVRGGYLTRPPEASVLLRTRGGLRFAHAGRSTTWRACSASTRSGRLVCATPAGPVTVGRIITEAMMVGAHPRGVDAGYVRVRLTPAGAEQLATALGVSAWAPDALLGTLQLATEAR